MGNFKTKLIGAAIKAKRGIVKYGPTACTVLGCVGVAATGVLAWRGRAKCDDILSSMDPEAPLTEKVKATWKAWVPPVAVGAASAGAIIFGHALSRKQIAALIAVNAANTGVLLRTKESIDERIKEVRAHEKEMAALPDNERKQAIFESDCDLNIVCLDPDGNVYWDDWTGIWFRQRSDVVERAYYAFNREYADLGWVSIARLYELFGFGKSEWAQTGIKHKFSDIGFERYLPFEQDKDFIDQYTTPSGEDFIDFREICGKKMRIYGKSEDDIIWDRGGDATRITYSFIPHTLYKPYMTAGEFDEYAWNMSFSGNRRFSMSEGLDSRSDAVAKRKARDIFA